MDWMALIDLLIKAATTIPVLWAQIKPLIDEVKLYLSTDDLAALEAKLAELRASMPAEMAAVDAALDKAAKDVG